MITSPLALFHFQQEANYSAIANAVAIPMNDFWIMPCGVMAILLMPLGLEKWPLRGMGSGIHYMLVLAHQVSSWPGAVTHVPALPAAALIMAGFGGIWIIIWRQKWRRLGLIPVCVGLLLTSFAIKPDLLVSETGSRVAVRLRDGSLAVSKIGKRDFTVDAWNKLMASPGVQPIPQNGTMDNDRLRCTDAVCIFIVSDKDSIALLRDPAQASVYCDSSTIVISPMRLQTLCAAKLVVDPEYLKRSGAITVRFKTHGYEVSNTSDQVGRRPWSVNTDAAIPPADPEP